jgi:hypothetical protein
LERVGPDKDLSQLTNAMQAAAPVGVGIPLEEQRRALSSARRGVTAAELVSTAMASVVTAPNFMAAPECRPTTTPGGAQPKLALPDTGSPSHLSRCSP